MDTDEGEWANEAREAAADELVKTIARDVSYPLVRTTRYTVNNLEPN